MARAWLVFIMVCSTLAVKAQTYIVIKTMGTVKKVSAKGSVPIKAQQNLSATDVVNIGTYSMLELLDEQGMKRICIKRPGQDTVLKMMQSKDNSVIGISKQYLDYVKSMASRNRAVVMSDPATITMAGANADSLLADNEDAMRPDADAQPFGFRQMMMQEYNDFRHQCLEQYIEFVRDTWQEYGGKPARTLPPIKDVPPVPYNPPSEDTCKHVNKPIAFAQVMQVHEDEPQPVPMTPIPAVEDADEGYHSISFYGTPVKVRFSKEVDFHVAGVKEAQVADALKVLGGEQFDNTIRDCLENRCDLQLSDWAYLQLLSQIANQVYGKGSNEAVLLTAYIYMQSGYKVRLATDKFRLYMLVASKHDIYGKNYFELDGVQYYSFDDLPMSLHICNVEFPKEKPLSLFISTEQKFAVDTTATRTVESARYPEMKATFSCNQNDLDFYATYPSSQLGDNVASRWAMYANTPLPSSIKAQIYPSLKEAVAEKSELEGVERLLNWVQTGFVYEYDDKVWGGDRAFFAEETLHYPYCDCEDRSVLFTRLVRDLLGLKCILVYYPGHLATAVCFTDPVEGDYIDMEGQKFVVCDPTYIGASVGRTMSGMDNETATIILLE